MSQTIGSSSASKPAPTPSTATQGNTGREVKVLRIRELTGVSWLLGTRLEAGKEMAPPDLRMIRQRISVVLECSKGAVEIPDAMIKSIEYA